MRNDYTESAQQALKLAKQAAKSCGHSYTGSEHLLLGLLRDPKGTEVYVLRLFWVEVVFV